MGKPNKVTAAIREHWGRVAGLGCIITSQDAEVAHTHGGSITRALGQSFRPGWSQKQNHWLVIPLSPLLHRQHPKWSLDAHPEHGEAGVGVVKGDPFDEP